VKAVTEENHVSTQHCWHFGTGVGLAMVPGGAGAQQKSIKDQVVGAWTLLLADNVKDDGAHVPGYGPNPEGLLAFTADGHIPCRIVRYGRPAFASKNRMAGSADEKQGRGSRDDLPFRRLHRRRGRQGHHVPHRSKLVSELGRDGAKASLTAITDEVLSWNTLAPSAAGMCGQVAWKRRSERK